MAAVISATERLDKLRGFMREEGVHAYIVPSEDAHQSEYTPDHDARRAFISGFTGSAGMAVVTLDAAALWTDGRYFLQAGEELSEDWQLQKSGLPDTPSMTAWLAEQLSAGQRAAVDPLLVTFGSAATWAKELKAAEVELHPLAGNLIDAVWADAQPAAGSGKLRVHPLKYAGESVVDKLARVREALKDNDCTHLVVTKLDEVAWLLNMRGSDVLYNPVFVSYFILSAEAATLYIDDVKLTDEARAQLEAAGVTTAAYVDVLDGVLAAVGAGGRLWLPTAASWAIHRVVPAEQLKTARSPIQLMKAQKNEAELDGMRAAHVRDCVALVNYFSWLQAALEAGDAELDECSVAAKLEAFRAEQEGFICPSFSTISSTGSNGAIIHYSPHPDSCAKLSIDAMYLCDSGGQYVDGTTDITRTWHFGEPSEHERRCFTRVLQGHIALARAVFPSGTAGTRLDVLARTPLWEDGLEYLHGTGHGVGAVLNVHEGPQGIGTRPRPKEIGMYSGMTITNEPGYYEDGAFGIRIEDVMVVRDSERRHDFKGLGFCELENLTWVPIQRSLVVVDLLTKAELTWLNDYHATCRTKLADRLEGDALAWFMAATEPLER
eukprot:PLAT16131.2.p1 GENE.PLAT16131.2~~PLAT16131.2.p1  ORF type:complete len:606 (-),score=263.35 PLAT16131.2:1070-2887(-)